MLSYAQLQAGIEANQIYFDNKYQTFNCYNAHYLEHSTWHMCYETCPFLDKTTHLCGLPSEEVVKTNFSSIIYKHNPEYLL